MQPSAKQIEQVMERLKMRHLRLIIAVGTHRSILHAAKSLNLSQPAATILIKDLETDLKVQLFERSNRGVIPTPIGRALIRNGMLMLNQVSRAAQELGELRDGLGGQVVVGTLLAASGALLPRAIVRAGQNRPNLHVKVVEGTNEALMVALRSGELDMVVGRLPTYRQPEEVVQERLYDDSIVALCRPGHEVLTRGPVTLEALLDYRWILPPPETTLRRQIDQAFHDQGLSLPDSVIESVSFLTNRRLLAETDLIGILPNHIADPDIEAGILASIDWEVPLPIGPVGVSFHGEGALSPAGMVFLQALKAEAESLR
ncbi:LysR substrate-binding domain-containing protein [Mesorhizobium sp. ANAO-SY3R2]|uniref:LysR substrate-binding domain-containing protein n=1 Tax=Mesorhizobium sp. ANAO-SY3R2 TaxID=3166644 RepID=UPI00366B2412